MTDLATLQARLTEAEEAYHLRMLGKKPQRLGSGDSSVDYGAISMSDLRDYIAGLQQQLASAQGTGGRRAIGLVF